MDGFVVALTTAGVPLLPNAIRLAAREADLAGAAQGNRVRFEPGLIQADGLSVYWDAEQPPLWEPRLSRPYPGDRLKVLARAQALGELASAIDLELLAAEPSAQAAAGFWQAIAAEHGTAAAQAARELIGRGPGLTPEGDDLVAGTVATFLAWAPAFGRGMPPLWLSQLLSVDLRRRTTAISATLLELALDGCVAEPLTTVLDVGSTDDRWRGAWAQLLRLGHSTGRALALAAARTGIALCVRLAPEYGALDEATVAGA
ncbi:MAG: DUF2877 domain-containing protein [Candidatus Dormibacteraeota bacterium]|uniref:DUF2877 domain-containing protein n=1 Tax=Candidatus Dormiibacter inghamiae TaxID=3127013 RepID=A0A934KD24_9BACT|nr:DUF2877 domain-containing protein [Candidatus Dormibacteraeota bacterium]MBJ7606358.1 DUF2877 domain-containing protein [Candidatus Dormibacteraeota bacterium]